MLWKVNVNIQTEQILMACRVGFNWKSENFICLQISHFDEKITFPESLFFLFSFVEKLFEVVLMILTMTNVLFAKTNGILSSTS